MANEAWHLLAGLVYPPPFLAIAREFGLRPATFGALRALGRSRSMSELAALLHCDNSNVTGIVDNLEDQRLAVRKPAEDDRRIKVVELSVEGEELRAQLVHELEKPPSWLESLSPEDQEALRDLLRRAAEAGG